MNRDIPHTDIDLQTIGVVLAEIQNRWNAAASTWDVEALSRIYGQDALFFGLLPRLYVGRGEIEEYFGSYRDVLEGVSLTLIEQNARMLGPGIVIAQGFAEILNRRRNGTVAESRIRSSFVIVKVDNVWQISLHHFSEVPGYRA